MNRNMGNLGVIPALHRKSSTRVVLFGSMTFVHDLPVFEELNDVTYYFLEDTLEKTIHSISQALYTLLE